METHSYHLEMLLDSLQFTSDQVTVDAIDDVTMHMRKLTVQDLVHTMISET